MLLHEHAACKNKFQFSYIYVNNMVLCYFTGYVIKGDISLKCHYGN